MTSSLNGNKKPKPSPAKKSELVQPFNPAYLDLDQRFFLSPKTARPVRVDEATDEEFDEFIRQYISLGWTVEERLDALIDAIEDGQPVIFVEPVQPVAHVQEIGLVPNFSEGESESPDAS